MFFSDLSPFGNTSECCYTDDKNTLKKKQYEQSLFQEVSLCLTCLWLSLELAGDFGEEFEGETSSRLPVTYGPFAVACLAALNPIGPIQTVCKERKHHCRVICFVSWNKKRVSDWI